MSATTVASPSIDELTATSAGETKTCEFVVDDDETRCDQPATYIAIATCERGHEETLYSCTECLIACMQPGSMGCYFDSDHDAWFVAVMPL